MSTGEHFKHKLEDNPYRKGAVIYKYTLPLDEGDKYIKSMPEDAEIIHVGAQGSLICIWAVINPLAEHEDRFFQIVGTGIQFNWSEDKSVHWGTVQMGAFVWHVFEQVGGF